MTCNILHLSDHRPVTEADVDKAWEAYTAHRLLELGAPWLADDAKHAAESERLFQAFFGLFSAESGMGSNVIPFRRSSR